MAAPLIQHLYSFPVFFCKSQNQRTDGLIGKMQLRGQLLHQLHAPGVELCHQGAGTGVIACVNNSGVGLGGAHRHVVFLFQYTYRQLVLGKLPGNGCAYHAAAHDSNLILTGFQTSFLLFLPIQNKKAAAKSACTLQTSFRRRSFTLGQYFFLVSVYLFFSAKTSARRKKRRELVSLLTKAGVCGYNSPASRLNSCGHQAKADV